MLNEDENNETDTFGAVQVPAEVVDSSVWQEAIKQEGASSKRLFFAGILLIIAGVLLLLHGIGGEVDWLSQIPGIKIEMADGPVGFALAIMGGIVSARSGVRITATNTKTGPRPK